MLTGKEGALQENQSLQTASPTICLSLDENELESYIAYGNVSFAEPILQWMARSRKDLGLGRIIIWLRKQFIGLNMLKCS